MDKIYQNMGIISLLVVFNLLSIAYLFGQMLEVFSTLNVTPLCIGSPIRVKQFYDDFRGIFHESVFHLFHNFRAGIGGCSRGSRTRGKKLQLCKRAQNCGANVNLKSNSFLKSALRIKVTV